MVMAVEVGLVVVILVAVVRQVIGEMKMKKLLTLLIVTMMSLFAVDAFAYTAPPKPDNGWYIVDQAGKLSQDDIKKLNVKIENLNKTTKNEYGALILNSLDGESIDDVAQTTFRSWGIGKKDLNNGVLLVIAVGDRKSRIQTGKGAEGDLPDLLCNDILTKTLRPRLKANDFYGGVNDTIDAMASHVENRNKTPVASNGSRSSSKSVAASEPTSDSRSNGGGAVIIVIAVVVLGIGFAVWYMISSDNKREEEERRRLRVAREHREFNERQAFRERQNREAQEAEDRRRAALNREVERKKKIDDQNSSPYDPFTSHPFSGSKVEPPKQAKPVVSVKRVEVTKAAYKPAAIAAVGGAVAVAAAYDYEADRRKAESRRRADEEREESERAARRRREQEDEDRRRRDREDDDRRSSSSSGYSSSWSDSSSSSSDSGSGFGGGDSGGGGSSSDW
jgi:uncharacterized membrane protein YgcG